MDIPSVLGINLDAGAQRTLERIYGHLPVMIYAVNAKGNIIDVNDYWLKRLGRDRASVLGHPSDEFMPLGDSMERRAIWTRLARGEEVGGCAMQYKSSTDEVVDGLLYGAPIHDAEGRMQGAIAAVFDVTELRVAQRERDQLETELRLSQKLESIGQLAAGIAHEINTPSQYVSDNLTFLQTAVNDILPLLDSLRPLLDLAAKSVEAKLAPMNAVEDYRALVAEADLEYLRGEIPLALQQSRDGVAQIKKIVLAMREFSHPGQNEREPLDLNRAVEATINVARNEWKYVADIDLQLGMLPHIDAIPSSINQVILNLVVNAAHAIEEVVGREAGTKGRIRVSTRCGDGHVELSIQDTGCGIPAENMAHIFDPFFTTKEVGKGTGQGLAIVKRVVVDRHGGSIDVQSEVGKGTCICVRLPVAAASSLEKQTA